MCCPVPALQRHRQNGCTCLTALRRPGAQPMITLGHTSVGVCLTKPHGSLCMSTCVSSLFQQPANPSVCPYHHNDIKPPCNSSCMTVCQPHKCSSPGLYLCKHEVVVAHAWCRGEGAKLFQDCIPRRAEGVERALRLTQAYYCKGRGSGRGSGEKTEGQHYLLAVLKGWSASSASLILFLAKGWRGTGRGSGDGEEGRHPSLALLKGWSAPSASLKPVLTVVWRV